MKILICYLLICCAGISAPILHVAITGNPVEEATSRTVIDPRGVMLEILIKIEISESEISESKIIEPSGILKGVLFRDEHIEESPTVILALSPEKKTRLEACANTSSGRAILVLLQDEKIISEVPILRNDPFSIDIKSITPSVLQNGEIVMPISKEKMSLFKKTTEPNQRLQTMRFTLPMNALAQGPHV